MHFLPDPQPLQQLPHAFPRPCTTAPGRLSSWMCCQLPGPIPHQPQSAALASAESAAVRALDPALSLPGQLPSLNCHLLPAVWFRTCVLLMSQDNVTWQHRYHAEQLTRSKKQTGRSLTTAGGTALPESVNNRHCKRRMYSLMHVHMFVWLQVCQMKRLYNQR